MGLEGSGWVDREGEGMNANGERVTRGGAGVDERYVITTTAPECHGQIRLSIRRHQYGRFWLVIVSSISCLVVRGSRATRRTAIVGVVVMIVSAGTRCERGKGRRGW